MHMQLGARLTWTWTSKAESTATQARDYCRPGFILAPSLCCMAGISLIDTSPIALLVHVHNATHKN